MSFIDREDLFRRWNMVRIFQASRANFLPFPRMSYQHMDRFASTS
jgi:hypothetical protein